MRLEIVDSKTVQRSALCRCQRERSNQYLLAKFGFDTAENKPSKVCRRQRIQLIRAGRRAAPRRHGASAVDLPGPRRRGRGSAGEGGDP